MKHIYISPHADDVALSCGGRILAGAARGDDMLVVTIFTSEGRQPPQEPAGNGNRFRDSINPDRAAEDRSAWNHLGIEADYADLPEALLRRKFPFAIIRDSGDPALLDQLHDVLLTYVARYPDAEFHFPAGIGHHVDHLACRQAAFRLLDEGALDTIFLYEDIPYSWLKFVRRQYYAILRRSVALDQDGIGQAFRPDGDTIVEYTRGGMVPFPRGKTLFSLLYMSLLIRNALSMPSGSPRPYRGKTSMTVLDADIREKKKDLLYHYRSQIPMLFGEEPDDLLRKYRDSFSREVSMAISRAGAR